MEHGLKYIKCYAQTLIANRVICYNPTLVRDKSVGSLVHCETRLLCFVKYIIGYGVRILSYSTILNLYPCKLWCSISSTLVMCNWSQMTAPDIKATNESSFLFPHERNTIHCTKAVATEVSQDWKLITSRRRGISSIRHESFQSVRIICDVTSL